MDIDYMIIKSSFIRNLISKMITKMLKTKLGIDLNITIKELKIKHVCERTVGSIDFDFELPNSSIENLIRGEQEMEVK